MGGVLGRGLKVAFARRTMRDRELGWTRIPARRVDRLFDEELRALELDENTERVDLNDYEASKQKLAEMHQAEAEAKREAEEQARKEAEGELRDKLSRKSPHRATGKKRTGRPRSAGSRRDVAERTGMSPAEQPPHRTPRGARRAVPLPPASRLGGAQRPRGRGIPRRVSY